MKTTIIELSEIKVPKNFAELRLKDRKEFERMSQGGTVFKNNNTLYLFEEKRVIIFKEKEELPEKKEDKEELKNE